MENGDSSSDEERSLKLEWVDSEEEQMGSKTLVHEHTTSKLVHKYRQNEEITKVTHSPLLHTF